MYYQLNNVLTKEIKMGCVQKPNEKYDIDVELFAELGYNLQKNSQNLTTWFQHKDKMGCVTATSEHDRHTASNQQDRTDIIQLDWPSMRIWAYNAIWAVGVRFQFRVQIRNPDKKLHKELSLDF